MNLSFYVKTTLIHLGRFSPSTKTIAKSGKQAIQTNTLLVHHLLLSTRQASVCCSCVCCSCVLSVLQLCVVCVAGTVFLWGKYPVVVEASNMDGNKALCVFDIYVQCELWFHPPCSILLVA